MNKESNSISSFQLFFFIVKAQLGVGIITLPAGVYQYAKQGAWISVLLSGILSVTLVLLYSVLLNRFEGMNVLDICNFVLGKWMGRFLAVGYLFYFLFVAFLIDYSYTSTMWRWILLKTPRWIILLIIMLFGIYFAKEKLQNITRFSQLTFWIILSLFIFSISAYKNMDWNYLFPIQEETVTGVLNGVKASSLSFVGFESILLIFPLVNAKMKKKVKTTILSVLFVTFLFIYITVLCTTYFSPNEFQKILEPTLFLLKPLTLFEIIERLDIIFLSIWIFMVVGSYIINIHLANTVIDQLQKEKNKKRNFNWLLNCFVFVIAIFVPFSKEWNNLLSNVLTYLCVLFIVVFPLFILLISLIFKKKRNEAGQL